MRYLLADRWRDYGLDPHCGPDDVRVQILAWLPLVRLDDLYFRRPHSVRLAWNYLREIGIGATLTKIASRHEERFRNETYLAVALGRVLAVAPQAGLAVGDVVELVATRHPAGTERAVVARQLVRAAGPELVARLDTAALLLLARHPGAEPLADALSSLGGWSGESGSAIEPERARAALDVARDELRSASWQGARRLDRTLESPIEERRRAPDGAARAELNAVLFGYGNYAKTAILPSLPPGIRLATIHEVDPLQMPRTLERPVRGGRRVSWDTSPELGADEPCDVAFIASFHHTHAPLAIEVLRRGGVAVVEKPLVTSSEQLRDLLDALRPEGRRLFACFHKRYSPFNELAREDLRVGRGEAISYHCIVYEVPLPTRHWYRWPSSRSCIVSNGCHWLDHFLFLNDYAAVQATTLSAARDGTVACTVALENGAFLTMTLTHQGSERLGVRDHVELRANGVTVTIENGAHYRAEGHDRVLRTRRQNRLAVYRTMYQAICRKIIAGEAGDSRYSVETTSRLALALDEMLLERLAAQRPPASPRTVARLAGISARARTG